MPDFSQYNKPVAIPGNTVTNALSAFSQRQSSTAQMVMQHGMNLEAMSHQHAYAKDLASHTGEIQSGLSSQEHSQTSSLSKQEHNQRLKETAAANRHETRRIVLTHNNDLEKAAVEHTHSIDLLRTGSKAKIAEGGAAHKNAVDLVARLHGNAQGGTPVEFNHNGISGSFTSAFPSPATNPTPTVAPTPAPTPSFVGMPDNRASAPKAVYAAAAAARAQAPAAAPKGPQPIVKRGANGRMVSLKNTEATEPVATTKKSTTKKAAVKGQPTVTRDPKTGRMIGIKKQ